MFRSKRQSFRELDFPRYHANFRARVNRERHTQTELRLIHAHVDMTLRICRGTPEDFRPRSRDSNLRDLLNYRQIESINRSRRDFSAKPLLANFTVGSSLCCIVLATELIFGKPNFALVRTISIVKITHCVHFYFYLTTVYVRHGWSKIIGVEYWQNYLQASLLSSL